ncbi:Mu transposase C-terminal domain-containing protein [Actinosynnema mirum]|uniref:Transposase-like Mu C-terminal domain-containing protein n=1 Tax=Actinosynnema mirum (strain ATCC 29888 / DSM 43827 / JCM 3225 / NBRC 14064 / NCIMB 13271 / NRRL B-12336 / IMRU 3971 / 101) TaxID=446462 RepID=C6WFN2_ACTMD|nr:Mu transposase C-terminal domain-containing protein [Actinosynnema mirum]ACU35967.1 hypothetical protein Amir_2020 [Actinosynnema mirum DSM 43827]
MTLSRPPLVRTGDKVLVNGSAHTVTVLSAARVRLADVTGTESACSSADLFSSPGFRVLAQARPELPAQGLPDGLPADAADQARWWEHHIVEVITGVPPDAGARARPRPEYDPAMRTLRQRELAKVSELTGAGHAVALSTFQRLRLSYEKDGVWGLVDHRVARPRGATTDERVVRAIGQAVAEESSRSAGEAGGLRRRVEQILADRHGIDPASVMPARATFYRLAKQISAGGHVSGSSRRAPAAQPDDRFGTVTAVRPGEWMRIESTPLDVRVELDGGVIGRVELTWLIDLATRTIPAAVLSPATRAVDAALLLARSLAPEPRRPGWARAQRMLRSALPHRRLTEFDRRLAHAAARPVIVPETIMCDHGVVHLSKAFRNACRAMGITVQPSPGGAGEAGLPAVGSLFGQHVAGHVHTDAAWSAVELQELLDEWLVVLWQNSPQDGLRHPVTPGKALTPNEMYAALVENAGYVPVPLAEDDYVELLPATWRAINSYGVKIRHRTYDSAALDLHRRRRSGVDGRKGWWEVRHDPHDVSRVWVRDHRDGGWIQAWWTRVRPTPR